ncbi:MAG: hypothetical protein B6U69_02710 [Thermofilum sp. ex4484_15]|nr:MAG: hypothetical protein B6U69_02710 [Thermofilum sp. ex4484_15]
MKARTLKFRKEVWPLILLALDNFSPLKGLARIHLMFFIYHYVGYIFKPNLLGPYSPELERSLRNLIEAGLVKVTLVREGNRRVRVYGLTEEGKRVAKGLLNKISSSLVELGDVLIIKGNEIIKDLENLKKYYSEKPLSLLLKRCIKEVNKEVPYHLKVEFTEDSIAFVKDLAEELGLT